ncbi:hypothetical protein [Azospirillum brasilense]|uniref:hypothetical protein n=1 Tax=Azospirillum brasilense TaxID=192 RepID=UPI0011ED5E8D|nr:hypothetical protein [Azospirillum brasilense]
MKPCDSRGVQLNAEFSLEPAENGFDLILESWSGRTDAPSARNPDYAKALELLLLRLGQIGAQLRNGVVDSKPMRRQPLESRQIILPEHSYPIDLATQRSIEHLRLQIGRAVKRIGQTRLGPGGNAYKRLRLSFTVPEPQMVADLEAYLCGKPRQAPRSFENALAAVWQGLAGEDTIRLEPPPLQTVPVAEAQRRSFDRLSPVQREKAYRDHEAKRIGGTTEVPLGGGRCDILTDDEIIEVKKVSDWRHALGQILAYAFHRPHLRRRIHLFGKATAATLEEVNSVAGTYGVRVSIVRSDTA